MIRSGLKSFGRDDDAAARRAHGGVGAVVADDRHLAEASSVGPTATALFDLHAHALEALVEVDPVARGVEDAARLDVAVRVVLDHRVRRDPPARADDRRGRERVAARDDGDRRGRELGGRQVRARVAPPGRNSCTRPVTWTASPTATVGADEVKTKMPSEVASFASGRRVLHPEAVPRPRGHDAVGRDDLTVDRRDVRRALDVVDRRGRPFDARALSWPSPTVPRRPRRCTAATCCPASSLRPPSRCTRTSRRQACDVAAGSVVDERLRGGAADRGEVARDREARARRVRTRRHRDGQQARTACDHGRGRRCAGSRRRRRPVAGVGG